MIAAFFKGTFGKDLPACKFSGNILGFMPKDISLPALEGGLDSHIRALIQKHC